MLGYRVPAPNQALLVSGRKQRGHDALPFKIVTGHGIFVTPVFSKAVILDLSMQEAEVAETCITQQGLLLAVEAVIAFKVGDSNESIASAARRFQGDQGQMPVLVGRIFSGHLRSIVGSMTVEAIIREQQTLGDAVVDASKIEMARIGLEIDSLQISSIDDLGVGYIESLAAPDQASVRRAALVAQALADQEASLAQQESERYQADYERQTAVARAEYSAEIDAAEQKALQAGPLAAAKAQQAVLVEQSRVAARNAELREAELVAEVAKPAEAEANRVTTLARADADATRMTSDAAAAQGRIALDQQLIAQLPEMLRAVAEGLQGANLTVFDGATGVNRMAAELAGQGLAILSAFRGEVGGQVALPAAKKGTRPAAGHRPSPRPKPSPAPRLDA